MTNLSEVPHDKIVGLRVINHRGTTGVVTEAFLDRRYVEGDIDCYMVLIEWDNGGISMQRHYMLESVEVIQ